MLTTTSHPSIGSFFCLDEGKGWRTIIEMWLSAPVELADVVCSFFPVIPYSDASKKIEKVINVNERELLCKNLLQTIYGVDFITTQLWPILVKALKRESGEEKKGCYYELFLHISSILRKFVIDKIKKSCDSRKLENVIPPRADLSNLTLCWADLSSGRYHCLSPRSSWLNVWGQIFNQILNIDFHGTDLSNVYMVNSGSIEVRNSLYTDLEETCLENFNLSGVYLYEGNLKGTLFEYCDPKFLQPCLYAGNAFITYLNVLGSYVKSSLRQDKQPIKNLSLCMSLMQYMGLKKHTEQNIEYTKLPLYQLVAQEKSNKQREYMEAEEEHQSSIKSKPIKYFILELIEKIRLSEIKIDPTNFLDLDKALIEYLIFAIQCCSNYPLTQEDAREELRKIINSCSSSPSCSSASSSSSASPSSSFYPPSSCYFRPS